MNRTGNLWAWLWNPWAIAGLSSVSLIGLWGLCSLTEVFFTRPVQAEQVQADPALADVPGFQLRETPGQFLDVFYNGKVVARYKFAHNPATAATLHETHKPYLHIMNADGTKPITKGAGGLYTHHRGLFIGWNKIRHQGKTYDRWHMLRGEIVHQKFLHQSADLQQATFTSLTHWNDAAGKPLLTEARTLTFSPAFSPASSSAESPLRLIVDFQSKLTAVQGDVLLAGDPEHAGVHFRAAQEIDRQQTRYVFPTAEAHPKTDRDYPWVAQTFVLDGDRHSVVHMNHPDNPTGTVYSAYRDYGRFGAFFERKIPAGEALTVNYRLLILAGDLPDRQQLQQWSHDYRQPTPSSP